MNALTCLKSALRLRSGFIFKSLTIAAGALLVSCTSSPLGSGSAGPFDSRSYNSPAPAPSAIPWKPRSSAVAESEAFAKPVKERPGLATQWGSSVKSPFVSTPFTRASTKPYGVDVIYYNDREGLEAMNARSHSVSGMQQAAGGIVEWGIRGSFGMLSTYKNWSYDRRYVEGRNGGSYSIIVKNVCKSRVQVVLSVDGLDVLDGKSASVARPGYVIDPGKTLEVKGFRTSYDAVAAFRFSSVNQSYAQTRHGDTRNVGVIGLAAFLEKGFDPWTWMPAEVQKRDTATPFSTP